MSEALKNFNEQEVSKPSFEVTTLKKRLYELLKKDERLSKTTSFGFVVLACTVQGQYERALTELDMTHVGLEEYKDFEVRARRFIEHAKSLVGAIKVKYEICTSEQVSKGKQKELANTIIEHFIDLRKSIIAIEKIQKSVRAADMRSTLFFIRAIFVAIIVVFTTYMFLYTFPELSDLSKSVVFSWMEWELPRSLF